MLENMRKEKSIALSQRFNNTFSSGHSNFKKSLDVTDHRVFINRAQGSRLWDVDGNEYIDYLGAMGPMILGHRHPEYIQALKEFLDQQSTAIGTGMFFSEDDVRVGELITEYVPCAESVKICTTGTEAVQLAIRLARAHTGRRHFIRFDHHYHGWMDNVLGGCMDKSPAAKPFALDKPRSSMDFFFTEGKSPGAIKDSFLLPWNDFDALEHTLEQYGKEIAMILFEAFNCNHLCLSPLPGFLERIRELCDKFGIVMCMDEVITGFRFGLGGAQEYFGVTPDLAIFGKAMAGGLPFSAVAGQEKIMGLLREGRVLGPGTFNGYPLGMRATLTTLSILQRNNGEAYKKIATIQKPLVSGFKELAKKHALPLAIQQAPGVFAPLFGVEQDRVCYTNKDLVGISGKQLAKFRAGMQAHGVISIPDKWYLSISHTEKDVEETLEAADKVMAKL